MGKILHHPHPVITSQTQTPTFFDSHPPLSRNELKSIMKCEPKGDSTLSGVRRPFAGNIVTVQSPDDPEWTFDIKRATVSDHIARQNLASTMRYVTEDTAAGSRYVTERDYPVGDLKLETVTSCLAGWNFKDENNAPIPVNPQNIKNYLSPAEFEFLYTEILKINPMWAGAQAEEDTKNA